jgi:hypothetical protein
VRTAKRELLYFLMLFGVPCVALISLGMATSSLPFPERLCTLEDTCAYGSCFILPGLLWGGSRGIVAIAAAWQSRNQRK